MAKRPSPSSDTPPKEFPEVPPSYGRSVGDMHLVESMMQIQNSIGQLTASVEHLKTASDTQSRKLDKISHNVFAAGVVITIVVAIGGFFLNKVWDGVSLLLQGAS